QEPRGIPLRLGNHRPSVVASCGAPHWLPDNITRPPRTRPPSIGVEVDAVEPECCAAWQAVGQNYVAVVANRDPSIVARTADQHWHKEHSQRRWAVSGRQREDDSARRLRPRRIPDGAAQLDARPEAPVCEVGCAPARAYGNRSPARLGEV